LTTVDPAAADDVRSGKAAAGQCNPVTELQQEIGAAILRRACGRVWMLGEGKEERRERGKSEAQMLDRGRRGSSSSLSGETIERVASNA
jgi:hypothetical protein